MLIEIKCTVKGNKIRSHDTNYCLIKVVTKEGLTTLYRAYFSISISQVYDGATRFDRPIAVLSGNQDVIKPIVSTSDSLFVWFTSDSSTRKRGFNATYMAISNGNV